MNLSIDFKEFYEKLTQNAFPNISICEKIKNITFQKIKNNIVKQNGIVYNKTNPKNITIFLVTFLLEKR